MAFATRIYKLTGDGAEGFATAAWCDDCADETWQAAEAAGYTVIDLGATEEDAAVPCTGTFCHVPAKTELKSCSCPECEPNPYEEDECEPDNPDAAQDAADEIAKTATRDGCDGPEWFHDENQLMPCAIHGIGCPKENTPMIFDLGPCHECGNPLESGHHVACSDYDG